MQENFKCVHQVSNAEINLMNLFIKIDYKIKSFSFYWPSIFVLSIVLVIENIAGVSVSVLWWEIKFLKLLDGRQCSAFYFLYYFMIYSVSHNVCYLNYVFFNHGIFCARCSQIVGILDFLHLVCR